MKKIQNLIKKHKNLNKKIEKTNPEDQSIIDETNVFIFGFLNNVLMLDDVNKEKHKEKIDKIKSFYKNFLNKHNANEKEKITLFFEKLNPLKASESIKKEKELFINSISVEFMIEESLIINDIKSIEDLDYYIEHIDLLIIRYNEDKSDVKEFVYESLLNKFYVLESLHEFTLELKENNDDNIEDF
jgi:hypothetical protein